MELEQDKFEPKGRATDYFDAKSLGPTRSAMFNMAYMKDQAVMRNKIYLGLIGILIVAMVVLALTANYKTYVVRVDTNTGQIYGAQLLKAVEYHPQEAELKYFLREFIRDTRTVPVDVVLYRQHWDRAQHFMTPEAGAKYAQLLGSENFMAHLGEHTVQPTITVLQRQPGQANVYEIRWQEETFTSGGKRTEDVRKYVGLFSVVVQPPKNEAELSINPLGIMIKDLSYQRETGG